MKRPILVGLAVVLAWSSLAGCIPIASGPYGIPVDATGQRSAAEERAAKLRVSAREVPEMSSPYFGEIEFTLENPTAQWVRVDNVTLDFGSVKNNQSVYFPWGSQLESWADATHQRNVIKEANDAIAIELLVMGGSLLASASPPHANGLRVLGGLASLAAVTAAAGATLSAQAAVVQDGPVFAGRHLFAVPWQVPPGLFTKRFVVVNTPNDPGLGCFTKVILGYELADKSNHRVAVEFRSGTHWRGTSQWQAGACPRGETN